jgi:hypothetical protein
LSVNNKRAGQLQRRQFWRGLAHGGRSIAAATAPAYGSSAGSGLTREKNVLILGRAQRVAIQHHNGVSQAAALPRLDVLAAGRAAKDRYKRQKRDEYPSHGKLTV